METTTEKFTLRARDGLELGATLCLPPGGGEGGPVVLISPAAAVKRSYYTRFAQYLASRGFRVVTFDYRGVGDSRPRRLQGFKVDMASWGTQDLAGAIDWVDATLKPSRLLMVGHSAGGHMLGLAPNNHRFSAILLVASQSGYPGLLSGLRRLKLYGIWYALIPGLTALYGYFPGSKVGLGEDLPAGVAFEWARWGRHPDFVLGYQSAAGYQAVTAPILLVSIDDDDFFAARAAVDRAASWYSRAQVERRHITPAEVGAKAIDHFGFFRVQFRDSLWPMAADWLERQARPEDEASPVLAASGE